MTVPAELTGIFVASAVRGAVVLAIALLLLQLMRRASAARRNAVLLGAFTAQLLIPLFATVPDVVATRVVPATIANRIGSVESAIGSAVPRAVAAPGGGSGRLATLARGAPTAELPFLVWMLGVIVVAGWMLAGRARVWWVTRRLTPLGSGPLGFAADEAARALGVSPRVEVLVSDAVGVPVTWGIVRPRILVPADAAEWTGERLRLVMLHEMAHVRRHDALGQAIASLALVLFWFNPLGWIAARRLRATAERAADDMVMKAGVEPSRYVDTLLDLVRQLRHEPALGATFAMARRGEFEGRMLAVLDERVDRAPLGKRRAVTWGIAALAAAALLGAARGAGSTQSAADSMSQATVPSIATSLLAIAERSRGERDIATLEVLEQVIATGALSGEQVDRYLAVVRGMRQPIPRGMALRALSGAVVLDSARLATTLALAVPIGSQVERSVTLATIARSQSLDASHRAQYYAAASTLNGPALTSALDALRR